MRKILSRSRTICGLITTTLMVTGYVVYLSQHEVPLPKKKAQPVPAALETVFSDICNEITETLPEPERVLRPTLLLPIDGDREGLFTEKIRGDLNRHGWYRPSEKSLLGNVLDAAQEVSGFTWKDSRETMSLSPTELAALMKSAKTEVLLRGRLDRLTLPRDAPVEMKASIELWEIASDRSANRLFSGTFERPRPSVSTEAEAETLSTSTGIVPTNLKIYGVIALLCLVWPWLTVAWMKKAIREDSNEATLKTLLGITAIPLAAFAAFLWYRGLSATDMTLQILLFGLLLFFYASAVMSKVQSTVR